MPYTCPRCRATSPNPADAEHGYCGNCHDHTGALIPIYRAPCPGCSEPLNALAPAPGTSNPPQAGDFALCDWCGTVLIIGFAPEHRGMLRLPRDGEPVPPDVLAASRLHAEHLTPMRRALLARQAARHAGAHAVAEDRLADGGGPR